jgi:hypothetical protein
MPKFPILTPTLQLGFYQRLIDAENTFLLPALLEQVSNNLPEMKSWLLSLARVCEVNLSFLFPIS